jgi:hypothetical protein
VGVGTVPISEPPLLVVTAPPRPTLPPRLELAPPLAALLPALPPLANGRPVALLPDEQAPSKAT